MPKYFLLAEAVNQDAVVFDTQDISTIRGGSFMLLQAIEEVVKQFKGRLRPISTAASEGLFEFEAAGDLATQRAGIALEVLATLRNATDGHATFLVAVEPEIPEHFPDVLERLKATIRRDQWRMPTVIPPLFAATDQECFVDGWRPGVTPYTADPDAMGKKISAASHFRREKGREVKQSLFRTVLNDPSYQEDDLVVKDLGRLAADPRKGILNGKIAYLHVDGNSFGRIRGERCKTRELREAYDVAIQDGVRKPFLRNLLTMALADPDFQAPGPRGKPALRIEVLLWGGDEITLIVPAWKGLETLDCFFQSAAALEFDGIPMSHRAALVFCHHNAPILQIRRVAEELLGMTKKSIQRGMARGLGVTATDPRVVTAASWQYGNAARYLVLESFDMLRGSLDGFLTHYYGAVDTTDLLLYGSELATLQERLQTITRAAPKGRILEVARALSAGDKKQAAALQARLAATIEADRRPAVQAALAEVTKDDAGWCLLADLWDYAEEWKA